jgi:RNA polymerase sigma factor (sigma-70 family)
MDTYTSKADISVNLLAAATDEGLVAAAKLGAHPAFVELWTRHSNTAFKMAYRIMGNRDDAEDAIQDAWMKAYVHLQTFDGRAAFSTWFTRIAINSALMMLRTRRAHPETSMEVIDGETCRHWEIADQTKDVEQHYLMHEDAERLKRAGQCRDPEARCADTNRWRRDLRSTTRESRTTGWAIPSFARRSGDRCCAREGAPHRHD